MGAPGGHDLLAQFKRGRDAHGLYGGIDAGLVGQLHHFFSCFFLRAVHQVRRAEFLRDLQPVVVDIDHDDRRR